jgi:uncharacterized protein YecA (UPF0149 family)
MNEEMKKHKVTIIRPSRGNRLIAKKIGRNDLCPCKSGKKAKDCCGTETKYFQTGGKKDEQDSK